MWKGRDRNGGVQTGTGSAPDRVVTNCIGACDEPMIVAGTDVLLSGGRDGGDVATGVGRKEEQGHPSLRLLQHSLPDYTLSQMIR